MVEKSLLTTAEFGGRKMKLNAVLPNFVTIASVVDSFD